MKDTIRVAVIQPKPHPEFGDPRNLVHAMTLLERCRGEDLDVICFPEYFPYLGEEELGRAARKHRCYLIAGMVEMEGERLFAAAVLFDRTGAVMGRQRKHIVSVFERESLGISLGGGGFRVFPVDFGRVGIACGADYWAGWDAPRQLLEQRADVIFNPVVFTTLRGQWRVGAAARALEGFTPVVGVNTADYNAVVNDRRVHFRGGRSFVLQPPRMLDKTDFSRWFKSADGAADWFAVMLDDLEQVRFIDVDLGTARRFRKELRSRLGFHSGSSA